MKHINTVFFDAGSTLVHINMPFISTLLKEEGYNVSTEMLTQIEYKTKPFLDRDDVVKYSTDASRWETYFTLILKQAGVTDKNTLSTIFAKIKSYHDKYNIWDLLLPTVPPLLSRLKKNYMLGIISNSDGNLDKLLIRLDLKKFFNIVTDSYIVGVEKPDRRIFDTALSSAKAKPENSVYVGDLYYIDIVGARRVGMEGILIDPADNHKDKDCLRIKNVEEVENVLEKL